MRGSKCKSGCDYFAGFKELGEPGRLLEEQALAYASQTNMPIIGPNCLGVMNPIYGLNATFARGMALPGNLAFISQSGAMCTAVLDWSLREKIGFSSFVSIGSMADVGWGTLIDYLGDDPNTRSLLLYMETVGDARSFLTAAREVALEKPIQLSLKAGRSQAAAQPPLPIQALWLEATTRSTPPWSALARCASIQFQELFSMASVLSRQPLPKGARLSIVTNAGGPAVLATDGRCLESSGADYVGRFNESVFRRYLPRLGATPIQSIFLGDASAERYKQTVDISFERFKHGRSFDYFISARHDGSDGNGRRR